MSFPNSKKRPFTWSLFIPAIALGIVLFATDVVRLPRTSDDTPRTSFNGGLRGYTVMIITFPHQDEMVERVNVSERKTASHIIQYGQRPLLDYTEANLSHTT